MSLTYDEIVVFVEFWQSSSHMHTRMLGAKFLVTTGHSMLLAYLGFEHKNSSFETEVLMEMLNPL